MREVMGARARQHEGFIDRLKWHVAYRRAKGRIIVRRRPLAVHDVFWTEKQTMSPYERVMALRRRRAYWTRMARLTRLRSRAVTRERERLRRGTGGASSGEA